MQYMITAARDGTPAYYAGKGVWHDRKAAKRYEGHDAAMMKIAILDNPARFNAAGLVAIEAIPDVTG